MNRRQFLRLSSIGVLPLAGCSGSSDDAPNESATHETTSTMETTSTVESTVETTTTVAEPETQLFKGSGDSVTGGFDIEGGFTVVQLSHTGNRNFIVKLVDGTGGEELLANHIGPYSGNHPLYVPFGEYALSIEADGDWEATIEQPRPQEDDAYTPDGSEWSGEWPNYAGPFYFDGTTQIDGEYRGDRNFIVRLLNINGELSDLVFNEIDSYSGSTTISASGHGWIYTEAVGEWSLSMSSL